MILHGILYTMLYIYLQGYIQHNPVYTLYTAFARANQGPTLWLALAADSCDSLFLMFCCVSSFWHFNDSMGWSIRWVVWQGSLLLEPKLSQILGFRTSSRNAFQHCLNSNRKKYIDNSIFLF